MIRGMVDKMNEAICEDKNVCPCVLSADLKLHHNVKISKTFCENDQYILQISSTYSVNIVNIDMLFRSKVM